MDICRGETASGPSLCFLFFSLPFFSLVHKELKLSQSPAEGGTNSAFHRWENRGLEMEVTGPRSHSLLVAYLGLEGRPSDSQSTLVPSQIQRGAFTNRLSGLPHPPTRPLPCRPPAPPALPTGKPAVCEGLAREEKIGLRWGFYLIL